MSFYTFSFQMPCQINTEAEDEVFCDVTQLLGIMKRNPLDDNPVEVSKPLILDLYNNTQHFKIHIYIIVLSLVLLTMSLCTYFTLFIVKQPCTFFVGYYVIPNIILLPLISSRLDDWLGRSFSEAVQFDSKFAKVTVTGHSGFSLLAEKAQRIWRSL